MTMIFRNLAPRRQQLLIWSAAYSYIALLLLLLFSLEEKDQLRYQQKLFPVTGNSFCYMYIDGVYT